MKIHLKVKRKIISDDYCGNWYVAKRVLFFFWKRISGYMYEHHAEEWMNKYPQSYLDDIEKKKKKKIYLYNKRNRIIDLPSDPGLYTKKSAQLYLLENTGGELSFEDNEDDCILLDSNGKIIPPRPSPPPLTQNH